MQARKEVAASREAAAAQPPRPVYPSRVDKDWRPANAPPPFRVDAQPAPDIAWVAWVGAAVSPEMAPARPYYLRAPDAKLPADPLPKASLPTPAS